MLKEDDKIYTFFFPYSNGGKQKAKQTKTKKVRKSLFSNMVTRFNNTCKVFLPFRVHYRVVVLPSISFSVRFTDIELCMNAILRQSCKREGE